MEVHAEELHKAPGHGWKHYIFEFFMLFLAVFCGFLAENYREQMVENRQENQYIQSLIADLKSDQEVLSQHMLEVKLGLSMMDSLINILNSPSKIARNTGQLYYLARVAPRLRPLSINNRTFEQLKNSGGFRLISKNECSNRIMEYYDKFPLLRLLEENYNAEFLDYRRIASKIVDPDIFHKQENSNGDIIKSTDNPKLRSYDIELLKELGFYTVHLNGTRRGMLRVLETLKKTAEELIQFLKKEYHIE